jgi:transposase
MSDRGIERVGHMSDTELLPKPKPEPVRRLEVFTGSGRRRAWSAELKARIIADSYESGETVSAIARRHGLTAQQLFGWRRAAQQRAGDGAGARGSAFAPVIVDAGLRCPDVSIARACSSGSPAIEIVIGAATVRVPPGIDAATLTMVLRAMKAST